MKYLKKFENHTAYAATESGLILPNVSLCVQENHVHYNPIDPYNGHAYVDLGLPSGTKWATMNVGASSVTDYGNYYQYGKGAAQYAATSGDSNYSGTENPLDSSVDTAAQVWGGEWHMPTQAQMQELTANTVYEFVTVNGVSGGKFTAQNGNYLFIPASGYYASGVLKDLGVSGSVWNSTPNSSDSSVGKFILFSNNGVGIYGGNRSKGASIRPVAD